MRKCAYYTGYCPHTEAKQTILVDYEDVSFIGDSAPEYKKMQFRCPYLEECEHLDSYERCPVFLNAPDDP